MRATVEVRDGRPVVVRTGEGDEVEPIRREARTLDAIAGPGAPRLLSFDDEGHVAQLVVVVAPPLNLTRAPLSIVLDALARVADVLDRASSAGIGHGPIRDDDILGDGTVVLLGGWQRAADADPERDIHEFGRFVDRLTSRHRELAPIATRALAPDPPTFAALAVALRDAVPREQAPAIRRSRAARSVVAGVAVLAAVVGLVVVATPSHRDRAILFASKPRVSIHDNIVTRDGRRWIVGRSGDIVVTGAWNCDATPLPAVLRPGSGRIWRFTAWPNGAAPVIGRHATDVPGAVGLRVEHDGRCDRLVVVDGQGRVTVVR